MIEVSREGGCAQVERMDSELAKCGPKGQDQVAKTHESIFEWVANALD